MPEIILILIWIIVTLVVASFAGILGKKYGVFYPIAIMAALVVIANVLAVKIVSFGPFTVPAGVIAFSMTFLITDILSEKWGKRAARRAVWTGFYANLIFILSLYIAMYWKPAPYAIELADKFKEVLSLTPRIAVAGFIAYLISQHHDVWAFHFLKKLTKGKHLWLRNNASTIVSQLLDSVIFVVIAFYGIFPIWPLILGQWVVKVIIAAIDTPFMYGVIKVMDKFKWNSHPDVLIRKAQIKDAEIVRQLTMDYNIRRSSQKAKGFVEFEVPPMRRYEEYIKDNPYFYVAEKAGEVIGFLSAFTDDFIEKLNISDDITKYILDQQRPLIYAEQIAVDINYQNQRIGQTLFQRLINDLIDTKYTKIWGAVCLRNVENKASMQVLKNLKFKFYDLIIAEDGLKFNIYKRDI